MKKIKFSSVFITNMYFPKATIGLSKENKSQTFLEIKNQEEKNMREVSKEEMREVAAGKWKCNKCGKKFTFWIQLWSWGCHGCNNFKYRWVLF